MSEAQRRPRVALATLIACGIICVGVVGVTLSPVAPLVKPLAAVLTASAVVAELLAARPDFTVTAWAKTQIRSDTAQLAADTASLRTAGVPE